MEFDKLKELGFTDGEIKVYLALLQLGVATKGPIAKAAAVSESKIYEILERLKNKGMLSFVQKKRGSREVMHYKPANPILLRDFLDKKREKVQQEEQLLNSILPILQQQMKEKKEEYSAVIYEGFKGIQTNNKEVLELITRNDEWVAMGTRSSKAKEFNILWIKWLQERAKKAGNARVLFVDKGTWYYNQLKKIKKTQVGYLKGIAPASVAITRNRVMIFNYGEHPSCLAITNDDIARSFKSFFNGLWSIAEKEKS